MRRRDWLGAREEQPPLPTPAHPPSPSLTSVPFPTTLPPPHHHYHYHRTTTPLPAEKADEAQAHGFPPSPATSAYSATGVAAPCRSSLSAFFSVALGCPPRATGRRKEGVAWRPNCVLSHFNRLTPPPITSVPFSAGSLRALLLSGCCNSPQLLLALPNSTTDSHRHSQSYCRARLTFVSPLPSQPASLSKPISRALSAASRLWSTGNTPLLLSPPLVNISTYLPHSPHSSPQSVLLAKPTAPHLTIHQRKRAQEPLPSFLPKLERQEHGNCHATNAFADSGHKVCLQPLHRVPQLSSPVQRPFPRLEPV